MRHIKEYCFQNDGDPTTWSKRLYKTNENEKETANENGRWMPGEVNVALPRLKNKIEKINDALEMNHRLIVLIDAEHRGGASVLTANP